MRAIRRLTLLTALITGCPCLRAAPAEAAQARHPAATDETRKPAIERVDVRTLAESLGLEAAWSEEKKQVRLTSGGTELLFEADRREVLLNNLRIFMGDGAEAKNKTLLISTIDRDRLLLPILSPQRNEPRAPARVVVLDAGHGGRDKGTQNEKLQFLEKTFTIDVALRVKPMLEAKGFSVVMTRVDDTYVPLEDRPVIAAKAGADLFVSIHFNATVSDEVNGLETYALTPQHQRSTGSEQNRPDDDLPAPGNRFDEWSAYFGYTVHRTIVADLELSDRGLKRARFVVLRGLPCPGILVEGGFLSNPKEAKVIADEKYRERFAISIANAIDVYNQTLRRLAALRTPVGAGDGS